MASIVEDSARRLWRITKRQHASSAFDGEGAYRFGGRWNSPGTRVIYTSDSLALAALELLVHLDPNHPIPDLVAIPVVIPTALIEMAPSRIPESLTLSRSFGDAWADGMRSPAMAVPSIIIPMERNILLNPAHPEFKQLVLDEPISFTLDGRLQARQG